MRGAGRVAAECCRRDLPIGIIASLVVCTLLYLAVAAVLGIGEGEDLGVADVGASVGTYLVLAAFAEPARLTTLTQVPTCMGISGIAVRVDRP